MAVLTKKVKTRGTKKARVIKIKAPTKNGHRTTEAVKPGDVYILRPRRTPEALRRAKRLGALVRKELEGKDQGTLEETMQKLRGRSWS